MGFFELVINAPIGCKVFGGVVVFGGFIYASYLWRSRRAAALFRAKWNSPDLVDTVILHQFHPAYKCPSISPYALKLETWLRLNKVKYITDIESPMGSKGKCPWITLNGVDVADSQLAIEYIRKTILKPETKKDQKKDQLAIQHAVRQMLECNFGWCFGLERWVYEKPSDVLNFFPFLFKFSFFERWMCRKISRTMQCRAEAQGIGRHSQAEVRQMGLDDLKALSNLLGEGPFLLQLKEPSDVDCVAFGFLSNLLFCSPESSPYRQAIEKSYPNLCKYIKRMKDKVWPDWNDCCFKG